MGALVHAMHVETIKRRQRLGCDPSVRIIPKPKFNPIPIRTVEIKVPAEAVTQVPVVVIAPVFIPESAQPVIVSPPEPPSITCPTVAAIKLVVCNKYKASLLEMDSARRTADVVKPRQIAMYLARHLTLNSYPQIGRYTGGKDHTTVIHAVRRIAELRATDPQLDADLKDLESALAPT